MQQIFKKLLLPIAALYFVIGNNAQAALSTSDISEMSKAAESGDAEAQFQLGLYYADQSTLPHDKNEIEADKWLHKSAEQGHVKAEFILGTFYQVQNNDVEAVKWFQKSADQGYFAAQTLLGEEYLSGKGVGPHFFYYRRNVRIHI